MDTQVRQQFSLNVSDEPVVAPKVQQQTFDTQAFERVEIPGVSKKGNTVVAVVVIAALAGAAWFFWGSNSREYRVSAISTCQGWVQSGQLGPRILFA